MTCRMCGGSTVRGVCTGCCSCARVQQNDGTWDTAEHDRARASHGICHPCSVEVYGPEIAEKVKNRLRDRK